MCGETGHCLSLPALSRAVPFSSFRHIGHDFSKRLTSSQCVICLSSDTKPREIRTRAACAYLTRSTSAIYMYINAYYTRDIPPKRERGNQRAFLSTDFFKAECQADFSLTRNVRGLREKLSSIENKRFLRDQSFKNANEQLNYIFLTVL